MSWTVIARKDFDDAIRSRSLIALIGLFILACGGVAYFYAEAPAIIDANAGGQDTATDLAMYLFAPISVLAPITAIMVGYKAIVGEIDRGTMKLLLKQPHSRADILVGKIVGRTGVVAIAILAGLTAAFTTVLVFLGSFSAGNSLALAGLTILLALAYVSVTVAISASTKSTNLAAAGAIGVFLIFQFLWQIVPTLLLYVTNGFSLPESPQQPAWADFVSYLNPATSYQRVAGEFLPNLPISQPIPPETPFYNEPWFGLVILLAWVIVPASLGYLRLRRADL